MLFLIIFSGISHAFKYFAPSVYDFAVDPENKKYQEHSGFVHRHYYTEDKNHFGEIALMTLNTHVESDIVEKNQKNGILALIDLHHPAVFALQGLTQSVLSGVQKEASEHYEVACTDALFKEIRTNKLEVMPIFYDSNSLIKIKESIIEPEKYKNQAYACVVVFYDKLIQKIYTVINVDLPSTDPKVIDSQVYNIIHNLENSKFKDFPVFVVGTINTMSEELRKLVKRDMKNLIDQDKNNIGLRKTTFHNHGTVNDNLQRDFILLKDKAKEFKLNYSRILSRYSKMSFEHFPVFSILSRSSIN
ncbi:uncharacterized protein VICG_00347 [Vittaforma corneae ATCC 50505]|uniref:Uncharacterized protein n=1 Tax=Vittaforma corneae (strain ATCC 50505) TaxID=993615 RepID=L2GQ44_VITCO|nr:uncharacterized protein VICG_00347 [Vittaforma corneae ATCC 50505]ELA42595.1 hypothetical protein VICG_00347 [Vittaforma corneae ATCC 50505]